MSFFAGLTCVELCHFSVAKAVDLRIRSKKNSRSTNMFSYLLIMDRVDLLITLDYPFIFIDPLLSHRICCVAYVQMDLLNKISADSEILVGEN